MLGKASSVVSHVDDHELPCSSLFKDSFSIRELRVKVVANKIE